MFHVKQSPPGASLLIIGGGIAAYKCLELIRRLRERGIAVRAVMTRAAQEFITPLSVGALTSERVFTELFDLNDEREIGHIRLSREAALIVVAPATADLLAKMAGGHADDLASCVLMATDKPVLVAPAMNPRMWLNPATRRNVALLRGRRRAFRRAQRRARWPSAARPAPAAWPRCRSCSTRSRGCWRRRTVAVPSPLRGGDRGGGETARCRSPAATCSSPPARRTSPSIPCATSPTARPASRARPSPPRRARSAPR